MITVIIVDMGIYSLVSIMKGGKEDMTEKRFSDSERFIFCRNTYTDVMQMVDTLEHFAPVTMNDELAELLSQILWEHIQFVNEKKKGLIKLNNLRDFVKENDDLDNDILIALINKEGLE